MKWIIIAATLLSVPAHAEMFTSFSNHAGVSNAESTLNRLANSRCTTLAFVATNTPARSCSSTRRSVRYNSSSGASSD